MDRQGIKARPSVNPVGSGSGVPAPRRSSAQQHGEQVRTAHHDGDTAYLLDPSGNITTYLTYPDQVSTTTHATTTTQAATTTTTAIPLLVSVSPGSGPPGQSFTVTAGGLTRKGSASLIFTRPGGGGLHPCPDRRRVRRRHLVRRLVGPVTTT